MKTFTQAIDFEFCGIRLHLTAGDTGLIEFLQHFIQGLTPVNFTASPQIRVELNPTPFDLSNPEYRRLSRHLWIGNSSVMLTPVEHFPALSLKFTLQDQVLAVTACFSGRSPNGWQRWFHPPKENTRLQLVPLAYYLVYFPFIFYLEWFKNFQVLHAGAIDYQQQGIILAGSGGIGKSTFVLGSTVQSGVQCLSDNLILHDTQRIYAVPEPIALNPKFSHLTGSLATYLTHLQIASSHDRWYYRPVASKTVLSARPAFLFWLQWGAVNEVIPIDAASAQQYLLKINLLARELREYYLLAAALELAFNPIRGRTGITAPDALANLGSLLTHLKCYILKFKPNVPIATIFQETIHRIVT